jgi:hypothetical protein
MQGKRKTEIDSEWPLMLRMSKVFADPQRVRILTDCSEGETSPRRFCEEHREEGATIGQVTSDFDVLAQYDWIDPVESQGGVSDPGERLYRANHPPVLEKEDLAGLPPSMRTLVGWRVFETLAAKVTEARDAGTLEEPDQHLSWTPVTLDRLGWEKVISKLDALFYTLDQERREAEARLAESGEEPIEMTVALLGFESPRKPAPES